MRGLDEGSLLGVTIGSVGGAGRFAKMSDSAVEEMPRRVVRNPCVGTYGPVNLLLSEAYRLSVLIHAFLEFDSLLRRTKRI